MVPVPGISKIRRTHDFSSLLHVFTQKHDRRIGVDDRVVSLSKMHSRVSHKFDAPVYSPHHFHCQHVNPAFLKPAKISPSIHV
jgi:hypothetical protein